MPNRSSLAVLLLAMRLCSAPALGAQPLNLPFDALTMVTGLGSTTPQSQYELAGAPPTLLIDMPPGTSFDWWSSISTTWSPLSGGGSSVAFNYPTQYEGDKLWFQPTAATWAAAKRTGGWRVTASHSQVELVIIYGGGAPVEWARGSGTTAFSMFQAPPGDYNRDGAVSASDYSVWRDSYGSAGPADGSGNGMVDDADYSIWASNFASPPASLSAASAVPEPSVTTLAFLATLVGFARSGCRRACQVCSG